MASPVESLMATPDGDRAALPIPRMPIERFRLVRLNDLGELESGVYWPRLQPYFLKPYFRRLTYRLAAGTGSDQHRGDVLSTRGATGVGELDIAYIRDRYATALTITEAGLPDYCLTVVIRGALTCFRSKTPGRFDVSADVGLIYRGLPGTTLDATHDHERLAIWIPAGSLRQRLAGLLGAPGREDIVFTPIVNLNTAQGEKILRLVRVLTETLGDPLPFGGSDLAFRSFTDLLLYSMLQNWPSNYSERLAQPVGCAVPAMVRRAEEYIRAHAAHPIALDEVAAAAGCSVRSLQLGFKRFRATTPTAAILHARLAAVHQALSSHGFAGSVTDLAYKYGFSNPGRFTKLYRTAFGVSPTESLWRHAPRVRRGS